MTGGIRSFGSPVATPPVSVECWGWGGGGVGPLRLALVSAQPGGGCTAVAGVGALAAAVFGSTSSSAGKVGYGVFRAFRGLLDRLVTSLNSGEGSRGRAAGVGVNEPSDLDPESAARLHELTWNAVSDALSVDCAYIWVPGLNWAVGMPQYSRIRLSINSSIFAISEGEKSASIRSNTGIIRATSSMAGIFLESFSL